MNLLLIFSNDFGRSGGQRRRAEIAENVRGELNPAFGGAIEPKRAIPVFFDQIEGLNRPLRMVKTDVAMHRVLFEMNESDRAKDREGENRLTTGDTHANYYNDQSREPSSPRGDVSVWNLPQLRAAVADLNPQITVGPGLITAPLPGHPSSMAAATATGAGILLDR